MEEHRPAGLPQMDGRPPQMNGQAPSGEVSADLPELPDVSGEFPEMNGEAPAKGGLLDDLFIEEDSLIEKMIRRNGIGRCGKGVSALNIVSTGFVETVS